MALSLPQQEVLRALAASTSPLGHTALCEAIPHRHKDTVRNARMQLVPELVRQVGENRATAYELTEEGRRLATGLATCPATGETTGPATGRVARGSSSKAKRFKSIEENSSGSSGDHATGGDHRWPSPVRVENVHVIKLSPEIEALLRALVERVQVRSERSWPASEVERSESSSATASATRATSERESFDTEPGSIPTIPLASASSATSARTRTQAQPSGPVTHTSTKPASDSCKRSAASGTRSSPSSDEAEPGSVLHRPEWGHLRPSSQRVAEALAWEQDKHKARIASGDSKKVTNWPKWLEPKLADLEAKPERVAQAHAEIEAERGAATKKASPPPAPVFEPERDRRQALQALYLSLPEPERASLDARADKLARDELGPSVSSMRLGICRLNHRNEILEKEHGVPA